MLDEDRLRQLAGLTDEIGVLSIYVTADPRAEAAARPAWQVQIRNEFAAIQTKVRERAGRRLWQALAIRLDELQPDLARLLDPTEYGLGRALFAPLSATQVETVSVQLPLGTQVVLETHAAIRPLLAAWTDGAPAGVAVVSADGLRLVDYRLGQAQHLATLPYSEATEDWRELTGPAASNPALSQGSVAQRDLFIRRVEEHLHQFLRSLGPQLAATTTERGWLDLVVTGDARVVDAVARGLPADLPAHLVPADVLGASMSATAVTAAVTPILRAARRERRRRLAERVRDAALGNGTGAYGLGETLAAAQEGRVAHLMLDATGQWRGSRTPDGRLVPEGEIPPGVDAAELTPEPHLGERMIEMALRTGADISLLDAEPAGPLAGAGGVGALLRW